MDDDWIDDETLTGDAIIARFEELGPLPTTGPRMVPAGGLLNPGAFTFGSGPTRSLTPGTSTRITTTGGFSQQASPGVPQIA